MIGHANMENLLLNTKRTKLVNKKTQFSNIFCFQLEFTSCPIIWIYWKCYFKESSRFSCYMFDRFKDYFINNWYDLNVRWRQQWRYVLMYSLAIYRIHNIEGVPEFFHKVCPTYYTYPHHTRINPPTISYKVSLPYIYIVEKTYLSKINKKIPTPCSLADHVTRCLSCTFVLSIANESLSL